MSTTRTRSRTGCLTCKNRRKKCDEIRPVCERCVKAGMQCLGYTHLEAKVGELRRSRLITNKGLVPPIGSSQSATASALGYLPLVPPSSGCQAQRPVHTPSSRIGHSLLPDSPNDASVTPSDTLGLSFFSNAGANVDRFGVPAGGWQNISATVLPTSAQQLGHSIDRVAYRPSYNHLAISPPDTSRLYAELGTSRESHRPTVPPADLYGYQRNFPVSNADIASTHQLGPYPSSGIDMAPSRAGFYRALSGSRMPNVSTLAATPASSSLLDHYGFTWPLLNIGDTEVLSPASVDLDVENVARAICGTPTLDQNSSRDTLPFALYSYSRWITWALFEPLKAAIGIKYHVVSGFSRSENSQRMVVLTANLLYTLSSAPSRVIEYWPAIALLRNHAQRRLTLAVTRNDVFDALNAINEITIIQYNSSSIRTTYDLIRDTAPAYRRVCPEISGAPINLPHKLLHCQMPLRFFPYLDVLFGFMLCKPTQVSYDTEYRPMVQGSAGNFQTIGVQWIHGVPDEFVILLSRMHAFYVSYVPNMDPGTITEIQEEIRDSQSTLIVSPDPFLAVARLGVQEVWRQALNIYLHMGLCGLDASDHRVQTSLEKFIRLLEGIQPGHHPDAFLILPMAVAGIASYQLRHRKTIQERMFGLYECSQPGTLGYEIVTMVQELWARTSIETRPARWADWKIAVNLVCGIEC